MEQVRPGARLAGMETTRRKAFRFVRAFALWFALLYIPLGLLVYLALGQLLGPR